MSPIVVLTLNNWMPMPYKLNSMVNCSKTTLCVTMTIYLAVASSLYRQQCFLFLSSSLLNNMILKYLTSYGTVNTGVFNSYYCFFFDTLKPKEVCLSTITHYNSDILA